MNSIIRKTIEIPLKILRIPNKLEKHEIDDLTALKFSAVFNFFSEFSTLDVFERRMGGDSILNDDDDDDYWCKNWESRSGE